MLSRLADRYPRKHVMVGCDLIRAGMVPVLAIPGLPIWILLPVLFTVSVLRAPFLAALAALMPEVLPGDRYPVGNGIEQLVRESSVVIGFAAGGALTAALTPRGALLADAFAASAVLVTFGVRPRTAANGAAARTGFLTTARWHQVTEPA